MQHGQKYPLQGELQDGVVGPPPPLRVKRPNLEGFLWVITAAPINTIISDPRTEFNNKVHNNKEQVNSHEQRDDIESVRDYLAEHLSPGIRNRLSSSTLLRMLAFVLSKPS